MDGMDVMDGSEGGGLARGDAGAQGVMNPGAEELVARESCGVVGFVLGQSFPCLAVSS